MILGQVIYYEKELNKVSLSSQPNSLFEIDILGVDNSFLSELKKNTTADSTDLLLSLKEEFIKGFQKTLLEEDLKTVSALWKVITSPKNQPSGLKPSSEYQQKIIDKLDNGLPLEILAKEVLLEAAFSSNEEDFTLFYGLKVLNIINHFLTGGIADKDLDLEEKNRLPTSILESDLSTDPQILVVGSEKIKVLVNSINCLFVDTAELPTNLKKITLDILEKNQSISLVLVDSKSSFLLDSIQRLGRDDLLFSEIDFDQNISDNFFDDLVRKTLGVRLA